MYAAFVVAVIRSGLTDGFQIRRSGYTILALGVVMDRIGRDLAGCEVLPTLC
jgi:hypothetical protein